MHGIGLAALLVIAPSLCAGTWTVDDDGPADFTGIQQAIDALPAGETIVVELGSYGPFILHERMQIFGRLHANVFGTERPQVSGRSVVEGASTFTIAGLQLEALDVTSVVGRGRIEDCVLTGLQPLSTVEDDPALVVAGCEQLFIARTSVSGADWELGGTAAARIDDSTVNLIYCFFDGGNSLYPPCCQCGTAGGVGLSVVGSHVVAANSWFRGGDGSAPSTFSSCGGNGGTGLATFGSFVDLRTCTLAAGTPDMMFLGTPAAPLYAGGGTVIWKSSAGTYAGGAVHVVPPYAPPAVMISYAVKPGGASELWFTGPIDTSGMLLVAVDPGPVQLAHYEGPLWVLPDFLAIIPFGVGDTLPFALPATPALSGIMLTLQAVYPGLSGVLDPADVMTSNPDQLVIRY